MMSRNVVTVNRGMIDRATLVRMLMETPFDIVQITPEGEFIGAKAIVQKCSSIYSRFQGYEMIYVPLGFKTESYIDTTNDYKKDRWVTERNVNYACSNCNYGPCYLSHQLP